MACFVYEETLLTRKREGGKERGEMVGRDTASNLLFLLYTIYNIIPSQSLLDEEGVGGSGKRKETSNSGDREKRSATQSSNSNSSDDKNRGTGERIKPWLLVCHFFIVVGVRKGGGRWKEQG